MSVFKFCDFLMKCRTDRGALVEFRPRVFSAARKVMSF